MGSGSSKTITRYEDKVYVDPENKRDNTDVEMELQKPPVETDPSAVSLLNADDETPKQTKLIG